MGSLHTLYIYWVYVQIHHIGWCIKIQHFQISIDFLVLMENFNEYPVISVKYAYNTICFKFQFQKLITFGIYLDTETSFSKSSTAYCSENNGTKNFSYLFKCVFNMPKFCICTKFKIWLGVLKLLILNLIAFHSKSLIYGINLRELSNKDLFLLCFLNGSIPVEVIGTIYLNTYKVYIGWTKVMALLQSYYFSCAE